MATLVKVWIDEVGDGDAPSVGFSTPAGHATAIWRGRTPPARGDHDIELEIPGSLRWGQDLRVGGEHDPGPGIEQTGDGGYRLTARAVRLYDDMLVVDVGGAIVMLEVEGEAPADVVGRVVEFETPMLELHPTGI